MIKAILFDFDGVLTSDATGTISIMKYMDTVENLDKPLFEKAYRKHNWDLLYGYATHESIWKQVCSEMKCDLSIGLLEEAFKATPIDVKVLEIARTYKELGYKIGMITDNKSDRIHVVLKHFDLETLFDVVTISADVKSGKKEKEIFEVTLDALDLEANSCVFIDNNKNNLQIPNHMNMKTIYFDHDIRPVETLKHQLKKLTGR